MDRYHSAPAESSWPTLWPVGWLGAQFVVLAGLIIMLDADYVSVLWSTAVGRKLLAAAGVLFLVNVAVYWPLSWLLVRGVVRTRGGTVLHWLGLVGLTGACLVFLVIPAGFVLLAGPAAVHVEHQMSAEDPTRVPGPFERRESRGVGPAPAERWQVVQPTRQRPK